MYYYVSACNFLPWLICVSWLHLVIYTQPNSLLTTGPWCGQENHTGAECPGPADIFWPFPPFYQLLQPCYPETTFPPFLLLLHSLPVSSQPHCGYWMSLVCVWMSSLQKDVPQFVFHPADWTETSPKHLDAFEQNRLDVCPCSRNQVQVFLA